MFLNTEDPLSFLFVSVAPAQEINGRVRRKMKQYIAIVLKGPSSDNSH
jgi:hypothetical protein